MDDDTAPLPSSPPKSGSGRGGRAPHWTNGLRALVLVCAARPGTLVGGKTRVPRNRHGVFLLSELFPPMCEHLWMVDVMPDTDPMPF